jgi:hypothetical protein|tara:strand:- start:275 stop:565 length:291 start_codon:yes stop_codon:yes gene_type:complete
MNKNYIKICIDDTYISKDSENQFSENFDNNIIVEFKNDNPKKNILKFLNNHKKQSKKSLVIVSNVINNKNYLFSIVPTFQEALDIIEIEEIERLIS